MQEVLSEIEAWKARGDRIALATVIDVQRSAPRPPGAKMAVNSRGEIAGSVSGGCVEGAVAEIADGILRGDPPQLLHFGIPDWGDIFVHIVPREYTYRPDLKELWRLRAEFNYAKKIYIKRRHLDARS